MIRHNDSPANGVQKHCRFLNVAWQRLRQNRLARTAKGILILLIGAAAVASTGNRARADYVIASNMPEDYVFTNNFIGIGYSYPAIGVSNEAVAQEFKAAVSGPLSSLTASVYKFNPGTIPLNISVYNTNGTTTGALLGSKLFSPDPIPVYGPSDPPTYDLSSLGINLVANHTYIVAFTADQPLFQSTRYGGILLLQNSSFFGYPPLRSLNYGQSWSNTSTSDELGLTVRAVPEPCTVALLAAGSPIALGWFARRRWASAKARS
jgi:hypothetical protein